jgi:hypothetical protein
MQKFFLGFLFLWGLGTPLLIKSPFPLEATSCACREETWETPFMHPVGISPSASLETWAFASGWLLGLARQRSMDCPSLKEL